MSDKSSIEWTEATWNPVRGCTKISAGCKNCYASTFAERWRGIPFHPYEQGFDLRLVPEKLEEPLRWKKPRKIFVNSMSDLFQDGVPDAFIAQVWVTMQQAERHTYQILTKRPDRMLDVLTRWSKSRAPELWPEWPLPNVWLGVSVEDQDSANQRIAPLIATPAAKRFISYEPALGPLSFRWALWDNWKDSKGERRPEVNEHDGLRMLDWVIAGSESGSGARPAELDWFRKVRDQCQAAGVPFFLKQFAINGRKQHLPFLDGRQWMEYPKGVNDVTDMG